MKGKFEEEVTYTVSENGLVVESKLDKVIKGPNYKQRTSKYTREFFSINTQ